MTTVSFLQTEGSDSSHLSAHAFHLPEVSTYQLIQDYPGGYFC